MATPRSSVTFEPPHTTVWRFWGDVDEAGMRKLTFAEKELVAGAPFLLKLVDMRQVGNMSAGARKAGAEKVHDIPVAAVAIFGANFAIRVMANLVIRAGSIMRKIEDVPTKFFETEAECRAWLDSKRIEIESGGRTVVPRKTD